MSEKRRDKKGRLLRTGESQREDGRYEYKYKELNGKRKAVYSWRLVESDRHPSGKRYTEPLRTMEDQIRKRLERGEGSNDDVTMDDMFEVLKIMKSGLKLSTRVRLEENYEKYLKPTFGKMRVQDIKYTMIVEYFSNMMRAGYKISTLKNIHSIANGCLRIAVRDGLIRINPCTSVMSDLKHGATEPKKQMPLTREQQDALLNFIKNHNVYRKHYPLFVFLLGTGCRISEAVGIRWDDIDFDNETISINHQVLYYCRNGKGGYVADTPKTKQGIREIPLLPPVKKALRMELKEQMKAGKRSTVDIGGYHNFVFVTKNGYPLANKSVNGLCKMIRTRYNEQETELAKAEHREPNLLPHFTPHTFRHTYCTMLCEERVDIKMIQEIMGHNDIKTTLNIYAKVTDTMKERNYDHIKQAIKIG